MWQIVAQLFVLGLTRPKAGCQPHCRVFWNSENDSTFQLSPVIGSSVLHVAAGLLGIGGWVGVHLSSQRPPTATGQDPFLQELFLPCLEFSDFFFFCILSSWPFQSTWSCFFFFFVPFYFLLQCFGSNPGFSNCRTYALPLSVHLSLDHLLYST